MTTTTRMRLAGLSAAMLYIVVMALTFRVSPEPVRPLFDGFAPPEPYRWVNPPRDLAAGNEQPSPASIVVPMALDGGTVAANATTPDGQVLVSLVAGAVAPNPPDTEVAVDVTPLDPAELGDIPGRFRSLSNAYQVELTHRPSGAVVTDLQMPSNVGLSAAAETDTLLFSADGEEWRILDSQAFVGTHGRTALFSEPGYFLAAVTEAGGGGGAGGGLTILLLALVPVAAAGLLFFGRNRSGTKGGQGSRSGSRSRPGSRAGAQARRPPNRRGGQAKNRAKGNKARKGKRKR